MMMMMAVDMSDIPIVIH